MTYVKGFINPQKLLVVVIFWLHKRIFLRYYVNIHCSWDLFVKHTCNYQFQICKHFSNKSCQRGVYKENLWIDFLWAWASDTFWVFPVNLHKRRPKWETEIEAVSDSGNKSPAIFKMWLISSCGWFHRLTFPGNDMTLHFVGKDFYRYLSNDAGIEWVAQLWGMN